ncbi:MAG: DUF3332 domain-containing protein [Myxococcaceae bacterium]|nr:DUF3332 domain-containing protein [Myxococcaceae bacterium]
MLSRRLVVSALAAAASTGCYGKFAATKKLHDWNGSFGSKFVSTLIFWLFLILPVYELFALGDALIFNLIEFWTGSNPLATVTHADGSTTTLARVGPDTVRVVRHLEGQVVADVDLVVAGDAAGLTRDRSGAVLATIEAHPGGVRLTRGDRVETFSAAELEAVQAARSKTTALAARLLERSGLATR